MIRILDAARGAASVNPTLRPEAFRGPRIHRRLEDPSEDLCRFLPAGLALPRPPLRSPLRSPSPWARFPPRGPARAGNPLPAAEPSRYIVTLKGKPIATYGGEVKGLKATRPTKSRKISATTTPAKRYRSYLERQQDLVAARVGVKADKHYALSLNGFGTSLTPDQASALKRAPGVLSVVKDKPRQLTNDQNPIDYLGLSGSNGVWSAIGGKSKAGRGVVVGVIDSGSGRRAPRSPADPLGTRSAHRERPVPAPTRSADRSR